MTLLPVRRAIAAASLSALAVTGLAACGSDDTTEDASADASSESSESGDAPSAADGERAEGDAVPTEEFIALYTAAYEDQTSAAMSMELSGAGMGAAAMTAEGQVDLTTAPPQLAMSMDYAGEALDLRLVDGVMYLGSAAFADLGAEWLRVDISDPEAAASLGIDPDQFTQGLDPDAMVALFEASVESVTYGGEQDVEGAALERYDVVMDGAAAAAEFGVTEQDAAALPETLEYAVFLDADGLVRQLDMALPDPASGEDSTITIRFDDYGSDVTVEAPAEDTTIDFAELGLGELTTP